MKVKKIVAFLTIISLMVVNFSILSSAESYTNVPENLETEDDTVQPLYDIIHIASLEVLDDGVEAIVEVDTPNRLQVTITIYKEKGNGWSMLSKKTFSKNGTLLAAKLDYDFEPGVTYRAVANFYAGGETDSMEDIFSF